MNCSNKWLDYVKLFREKNPELTQKEALQEASKSYHNLKKSYRQKGGKVRQNDLLNPYKGGNLGLELVEPQMRYEAGVTELNSGIANLNKYHGGKLRKNHKGGNLGLELVEPQMRYEAGVSALNSGLANINRPIRY